MEVITKTERIVVLCTPDFKQYLVDEAKRESVGVSEIVRKRCDPAARSPSAEKRVLLALIQDARKGTQEASKALSAGLNRAEEVLARLKSEGDSVGTLYDALSAIREVMLLQADVKRAGNTLSRLSELVEDHEKRLIRMETRWETAMELRSLRPESKRLED